MVYQNIDLKTGNSVSISSPIFKKIYSFFLALYPILCIYHGFSRFTIGDVILMAFTAYIALFYGERVLLKKFLIFFPFVCYAVVILFVRSLSGGVEGISVVIRLIKLMFYMLCTIISSQYFLDFKIFEKWMIRGSVFSGLFVYWQYISYYIFGKISQGRIPFLNIYLDDYNLLDYDRIYSYQFRPTSIFLEPAIACQYMIVGLVLLLYIDKNCISKFKRWMGILIIVAGMVMTTSGQGTFYIAIMLIVYIMHNNKKNVAKILFSLIFIGILSFVLYINVPVVQSAIDRLLFNENAAGARMGSVAALGELSVIDIVFGTGYGNVPEGVYTVGAVYVAYGCGIIGFILACIMFYTAYKCTFCLQGKIYCILFFVMFFGTSLFYNYMFFWYFSLILFINNQEGIIENNENPLYSRGLST